MSEDSTSFASILAGVKRLREGGEDGESQEREETHRSQGLQQQQRPRPQTDPQRPQQRVNAFNKDNAPRPKAAGTTNNPSAISVNSRQKQNPLMNFLTNVNYNFVEQRNVFDFLVNAREVVFLSLKYHKLHPEYIHNRMKPLTKKNAILITVVDVENNETIMREINKACLYNEFTLLVAFTYEQAAKYLTYLATSPKIAKS
jgi:DNA excision repair protein ERCC-1